MWSPQFLGYLRSLKNPESAKIHTYFQIRSTIFGFWQQFLWPSVVGTECTEDALGLSKIAFGMQKLARIFNFDKQDIIDFTKLSKPAMCRAGPLICLLEYSSLPPLALECQRYFRDVGDGWVESAIAHPGYGESINPISTRWGRFYPHHCYFPIQI